MNEILSVLGIALIGGLFGAFLFKKLNIPQVVGYLALGIILGESGFKLIPADYINNTLGPLNELAFGIIGFLVGGELSLKIFKKYGSQFTAILLGEGLLAFFLVGIPSTIILYFVVHDWVIASAAGVVFGAIASATDPASTIDVLWEYRSAGVLTTAIVAIVALDDALAMTLYSLGTATAQVLIGDSGSILGEVGKTLLELGGALLLGALFGAVLNLLIRRTGDDRIMTLALSFILLSISAATMLHFDVILVTMAMGMALCNLAPKRSKELFSIVRKFSTPIYILFFVMVGARLTIGAMPGWIWLLIAVYVIARSIGKFIGAKIGGRLSNAEPVVQNYLGLAPFAQGGVAVALSIQASRHLDGIMIGEISLGQAVIFTVTTTTLIVQVIGPIFTRMAIKLGKEAGRNVTEEDIINELSIEQVMVHDADAISQHSPVREAIDRFSHSDTTACPVVNQGGELQGVLTFNALKEALSNQDCWDWLLVDDVMSSDTDHFTPDQSLKQVIHDMHMMQVEAVPILASEEDRRPLGVLEQRTMRRIIREELVRRQSSI